MSGKGGNYFALLGEEAPAKPAPKPAAATNNAPAARAQTNGRPSAPAKAGGQSAAPKAGPRKDRGGNERNREVKDRERKGPYKGRGRQFDKQSHSGTKQGAKTEKREGAGKANWGTQADDLAAQTAPIAVEGEEAEAVATPAAAAPAPEEDDDSKLVTYDDFLKQNKGAAKVRTAPARKAGEGVENKDWEKFVPVAKTEADAPIYIGASEEKKVEKAVAPQQPKAGGKKKKFEQAAQLTAFRLPRSDRPPREDRPRRDGDRPDGDRPPRRPREDRPPQDRPPRDDRPRGPREPREPREPRPDGARTGGDRARPPKGGPRSPAGPKTGGAAAPKAGGAIRIEDTSAFPALS